MRQEATSARPATSADRVRPVTYDRLKSLLDSQGLAWSLDDDGELTGTWGGSPYFLILAGRDRQVLQIVTVWKEAVPIDALEAVRRSILQWHRTRPWPKCSHRIDDDGTVRVVAETVVGWQCGATDAHLVRQIANAIALAQDFFSELARDIDIGS